MNQEKTFPEVQAGGSGDNGGVPPRKQFVAFDFDGTVIDTNKLIVDSWQHTFLKFHGYRHSEQEIYGTFGETLYDSMKDFFHEKADGAIACYREYQKDSWRESVRVFPGITGLLQELENQGRTLLLVTSRLKPTTMEYLEHFDLRRFFKVVITSNDTKAHKPDPEPVMMALAKAGGRPEESVMVGDTRFDVGCANNAGAVSILVNWSHPVDEKDFQTPEFRPDFRIGKPEDLLRLI